MLSQEEYKTYCNTFKAVWMYLKSVSEDNNVVIQNICRYRNYDIERMYDILNNIGFIFINKDKFDKRKIAVLSKDYGLMTESGEFLLTDRFIFPVKDMLGNIIALIGWYPDEKKYITTPSKLFSKECLFFGMEQLGKVGIGHDFVLVEGIFDCISVQSLGLNCIAQMGIATSRYKETLYSLFRRIVAIPDADTEGRKVVAQDKWKLPVSGRYFRWSGTQGIKDIDDLIRNYESEDVKELLLEVFNETDRVVTVKL